MSAVVEAARGWLGTPYRHQVSLKGEGADCLGLVRGVWREVAGEWQILGTIGPGGLEQTSDTPVSGLIGREYRTKKKRSHLGGPRLCLDLSADGSTHRSPQRSPAM